MLIFALSCDGKITVNNGGTPGDGPKLPQPEVDEEVTGVAKVGARRLSRNEYNLSLATILGPELIGSQGEPANAFPEDNVAPFENNWSNQRVSEAMVEGAEIAATYVSSKMTPAMLGCTPSGPDDAQCFTFFVEDFGKKVFRRSLTPQEIKDFSKFQDFSVESGDFMAGIRFAVQAFLQMPDFLYIIESGIPLASRPQVRRLSYLELASRLSFFLWGTGPDAALIDDAEAGKLDKDQLKAHAIRMLKDDRARTRINQFHAMWLGYFRFSGGNPIADGMIDETEKLIEKIVFDEKADYFTLFTSDQTYLSEELSAHYGLSGSGWVSYGDSGRGGVLSHGTFLSVAAKFGDTSPTQRGRFIREKLMCTPIDLPSSDLNVNVDEPPPSDNGSTCKKDRYLALVAQAGCGFCHSQTDLIGLGLENYSETGQYRTTDVDDSNCQIDGAGEIVGGGTFNGPKELGEVLVKTEQFKQCMVLQTMQFALGTKIDPENADLIKQVKTLQEGFEKNGRDFQSLLIDIVSSDSFLYREMPKGGVQ